MSALHEFTPSRENSTATVGQQLDAQFDEIHTTLRQNGILLRAIAAVILPAETLAELEKEIGEPR